MNLPWGRRLHPIVLIGQARGGGDLPETVTSGEAKVRKDIDYEWAVFRSSLALARLKCCLIDVAALFHFCRELREAKFLYFRVLRQYKGKYPTSKLMALVRSARKVMASARKTLSDCVGSIPPESKPKISIFLESIEGHLDEIVDPPKRSAVA